MFAIQPLKQTFFGIPNPNNGLTRNHIAPTHWGHGIQICGDLHNIKQNTHTHTHHTHTRTHAHTHTHTFTHTFTHTLQTHTHCNHTHIANTRAHTHTHLFCSNAMHRKFGLLPPGKRTVAVRCPTAPPPPPPPPTLCPFQHACDGY